MNNVFQRVLAAFLLVIATGGSACAEELQSLLPGTRIRATYLAEQDQGKTHRRQITGTLEELTDCTLAVSESSPARQVYIPLTSITRLERSVRSSSKDKAMKAGFIVGASIGAAIVIPAVLDKPKGGEWDFRGFAYFFAGVFTLAGIAIGALVAVAMPGEKWQDIDVSGITLSFQTVSDHEGRLLLGFRF